jgi:hypothetical protein
LAWWRPSTPPCHSSMSLKGGNEGFAKASATQGKQLHRVDRVSSRNKSNLSLKMLVTNDVVPLQLLFCLLTVRQGVCRVQRFGKGEGKRWIVKLGQVATKLFDLLQLLSTTSRNRPVHHRPPCGYTRRGSDRCKSKSNAPGHAHIWSPHCCMKCSCVFPTNTQNAQLPCSPCIITPYNQSLLPLIVSSLSKPGVLRQFYSNLSSSS